MLFSTHILSDVEHICDQVAFLHNGEIVLQGSVEEVKESRKTAKTALEMERPEDAKLLLSQFPFLKLAGHRGLSLEDTGRLWEILHFIAENKLPILRAERQEPALEDLFLEIVGKGKG